MVVFFLYGVNCMITITIKKYQITKNTKNRKWENQTLTIIESLIRTKNVFNYNFIESPQRFTNAKTNPSDLSSPVTLSLFLLSQISLTPHQLFSFSLNTQIAFTGKMQINPPETHSVFSISCSIC